MSSLFSATSANWAPAALSQVNLSSIASPWDLTFADSKSHTYLQKFEVFESTEDIVALACTADRLFTESKTYYKVTDRDLYLKVESQDRSRAKEIKDYYSKKVMMLKLQGTGQLSSFREDMNKLIHSDGLTFKESMIGIAYWLPKFYEYDTQFDNIKSQVSTTQNFENLDKQGLPTVRNLTVNLEPLQKLLRATKRSKTHEYWFKDDILNAAVVIHLEDKNQLQHLWDYLFENESTIKITGTYTRKKRDNFEYFSVTNWGLERG